MMSVIYSQDEMNNYLENVIISNDYPVVISKFITGAKEIEVDAVSHNGELKLWAISEHVEDAGVHSGDATLILPSKNINEVTKKQLLINTQKIAEKLEINGPFNIQYIAKSRAIDYLKSFSKHAKHELSANCFEAQNDDEQVGLDYLCHNDDLYEEDDIALKYQRMQDIKQATELLFETLLSMPTKRRSAFIIKNSTAIF